MITMQVKDIQGNQKENINLKEEIFKAAGDKSILFDVVKMQLNNTRQGTACTKTRAEVNKSGKKPWKQKGTGRARAGSAGSPVWRGGGIALGPRPHDFSYRLPKKVNRLAIKLALSEKLEANEIIVIDNLNITEPKTKSILDILKNLKIENDKSLFVLPEYNINIVKSARNLLNVKTLTVTGLNVYDVLDSNKILITKDALNKIQEVLS